MQMGMSVSAGHIALFTLRYYKMYDYESRENLLNAYSSDVSVQSYTYPTLYSTTKMTVPLQAVFSLSVCTEAPR